MILLGKDNVEADPFVRYTEMKRVLFALFVLSAVLGLTAFPQSQSGVTDSRPTVLEIEYSKGMGLAYQRIGGTTLFGAYRTLPDWKPEPEFLIIRGVNMKSRIDDGVVKISVSLIRGKNFETETPVGEYSVVDGGRTVVKGLAKFGIVPFGVTLVRSPVTVSMLPEVVNKTKALSVSVEPVTV